MSQITRSTILNKLWSSLPLILHNFVLLKMLSVHLVGSGLTVFCWFQYIWILNLIYRRMANLWLKLLNKIENLRKQCHYQVTYRRNQQLTTHLKILKMALFWSQSATKIRTVSIYTWNKALSEQPNSTTTNTSKHQMS